MKVCSKCGIERQDNEYSGYFHIRHQKYYIRGVCNHCMRLNSKLYKLKLKEQKQLLEQVPEKEKIVQPVVPNEELDGNLLSRSCRFCSRELPLRFFRKTTNGLSTKCNDCFSRTEVPFKFNKTYEEQFTYMFLKSIGWEYSDEHEIWWKKGIKDVHNNWTIIPPPPPPTPKVEPINIYKQKINNVNSNIEDVLNMKNNRIPIKEIAQKYELSIPTIRKIIKKNSI